MRSAPHKKGRKNLQNEPQIETGSDNRKNFHKRKKSISRPIIGAKKVEIGLPVFAKLREKNLLGKIRKKKNVRTQ